VLEQPVQRGRVDEPAAEADDDDAGRQRRGGVQPAAGDR
jgi:hypothetical protein